MPRKANSEKWELTSEPKEFKRGPILTIGHSTRPADEFLRLLQAHGVKHLVDIRTIPRSRRHPQFNQESLAAALPRAGIAYTHLKSLGGLRHPRPDSTNMGWRNASFRGYADYMQTPEFGEALERLLVLADKQRSVIMCAEAVPWRCHRSLVSDALTARGIEVEHILSAERRQKHEMTPFARVHGDVVTYPAEAVVPGKGAKSDEAQLSLLLEPPAEPAANAGSTVQQKGALEYAALLLAPKFGASKLVAPKLEAPAPMAGKKRKPKFTAAKEARRRARNVAGAPPVERVIPDKRRKPPKHKKSLDETVEP